MDYEKIEIERKFPGGKYKGMVAASEKNKFVFVMMCFFGTDPDRQVNMPYCSRQFESIEEAEVQLKKHMRIGVAAML